MNNKEYNKIWNKNFAQVRSVFELFISSIQDETIRKNAENTKVLVEEVLFQTRKRLDEMTKEEK